MTDGKIPDVINGLKIDFSEMDDITVELPECGCRGVYFKESKYRSSQHKFCAAHDENGMTQQESIAKKRQKLSEFLASINYQGREE